MKSLWLILRPVSFLNVVFSLIDYFSKVAHLVLYHGPALLVQLLVLQMPPKHLLMVHLILNVLSRCLEPVVVQMLDMLQLIPLRRKLLQLI